MIPVASTPTINDRGDSASTGCSAGTPRLPPPMPGCPGGKAGGGKAALVFTDPPYNVPIGGQVSGLGKGQHRVFVMASGE